MRLCPVHLLFSLNLTVGRISDTCNKYFNYPLTACSPLQMKLEVMLFVRGNGEHAGRYRVKLINT